MEGLDILQLFADTGELDGLSGNGPDRQGSTASGVAVQLTEHDGVDIQPLVEALGSIHCVLTGHGVHNQHDFVGLDGLLDVLQLIHQSFIDVQTAGGIQEHIIVGVLTGICTNFLTFLHLDKIMIGYIMLLIPGLAMTNSIRNILVGNTISGVMRLIEAVLWAAALALGFMIAMFVTGGVHVY